MHEKHNKSQKCINLKNYNQQVEPKAYAGKFTKNTFSASGELFNCFIRLINLMLRILSG